METTVQILRILGNLCYDCPDGRAQLLGSKCLEHVLAVARDRQGGKEGSGAKGGDPGQRFPVILPVGSSEDSCLCSCESHFGLGGAR